MPKFRRGDIKANQEYLKKWDKYQLDWLNCDDYSDEQPLLLPITVDIKGGVMKRHRVKTPVLKNLIKTMSFEDDKLKTALGSYVDYFAPIDEQQSGAPATPLDFNISCCVYHLFYLPRENWRFTRETQFSVSNLSEKEAKEAFDVVGTFADGQGLIVLNNNWQPKDADNFIAKYNLHVGIYQDIDGNEVRTDIIIDPGMGNDGGPGTGD